VIEPTTDDCELREIQLPKKYKQNPRKGLQRAPTIRDYREVKIPRFTGTSIAFCLPIIADVSIFTRNFYPFLFGRALTCTRKRQTGTGVFYLLFVGRLNSKNFQHLTQLNNAHMLIKVFNNQWRTSTAKVTVPVNRNRGIINLSNINNW
jgi:hypothetical protein